MADSREIRASQREERAWVAAGRWMRWLWGLTALAQISEKKKFGQTAIVSSLQFTSHLSKNGSR
jgi:hypothetical protein